MPLSEPADLAADAAVSAVAGVAGRHAACLPGHWNFRLPSGGYLMTVGLRAIEAEVADPSFRLVSATTTFCSPVPEGPVLLDVEILRRGNAAVQARAAMKLPGASAPSLEVAATLTREKPGPAYVNAVRPSCAPPTDAAEDPRAGASLPIFRSLDSRAAVPLPGFRPLPEPVAFFARWYRYRIPQRTAEGLFDPLALPLLADTMPPSVRTRLGGAWEYDAPSLDLTVHFLDPSPTSWVLAITRSRWARGGYASADIELWGEDGALLAFATQTMILRKRTPR